MIRGTGRAPGSGVRRIGATFGALGALGALGVTTVALSGGRGACGPVPEMTSIPAAAREGP